MQIAYYVNQPSSRNFQRLVGHPLATFLSSWQHWLKQAFDYDVINTSSFYWNHIMVYRCGQCVHTAVKLGWRGRSLSQNPVRYYFLSSITVRLSTQDIKHKLKCSRWLFFYAYVHRLGLWDRYVHQNRWPQADFEQKNAKMWSLEAQVGE